MIPYAEKAVLEAVLLISGVTYPFRVICKLGNGNLIDFLTDLLTDFLTAFLTYYFERFFNSSGSQSGGN